MNRTVKEATVKTFHYPDLEVLKAHVLAFVTAYDFAKHLKAFRWRTRSGPSAMRWKSDRRPSGSTQPPHPGTAHLDPEVEKTQMSLTEETGKKLEGDIANLSLHIQSLRR